ncbi:MAG: 8-oxo-dGTP diphosphatase [Tenericutes bacterium ADurb.Bin087]|nr:MAG: 8-oxo-dGTP diphosphatase [Tenericutes bacterium ADurb.Bin087]
MNIIDVTNVLFIKNNKVLLGYKKRGFGKQKYNGFGGKLKTGETIEMAAIREAKEEAGLTMKKYYKAGEIDFADSYPLRMHLFVCTEWSGTVAESDEMMPTWFNFDEVPVNEMWDDDKYWFHLAISGQRFRASFVFESDNDITGTAENKVVSYAITLVDTLD